MSDAVNPFNKLTPAEVERLALLAEEMGEAIQCIGKILRHGYESANPHDIAHGRHAPTNRQALEREMGDVQAALDLMMVDLNGRAIAVHTATKHTKVRKYLHHQPVGESL